MLIWLIGAAWAGSWKLTALPIGDYGSDYGVGYGTYGLAVLPGPDPEGYHRLRLSAQAFWSTGKFRDHWLKLDAPAVAGSAFRVDLLAGWEAWQYAPYFGYGNASARLRREETPENYYAYDIEGGKALVNLRRQLRGPWELFSSGFVRTARIAPYAGSLLTLDDPEGAGGGRYIRLGLGALIDTRDALAHPTTGVFSEVSARGAHPWLGSQWTGWGVNATHRQYRDLRGDGRLISATRVVADLRGGEEPFFMAQVLGGSQWLELGGPWGFRAYSRGRFRGDAAVLLSQELRWTVARLAPWGHPLDIMPTPFVDLGRVFVWGEEDPLWNLHPTLGLGARFAWDRELILRADVGLGLEDYRDGGRGLTTGIYFMFDHPF